ncbi:hypothetical protein ACFYW9_29525 [Streptomyces sp. NPDC002698]|uniref:hypothetical protein n=1 Tax=Streptomyces sp. NPDC002698 TaxID=3364660 RepID=UPI00369656D3
MPGRFRRPERARAASARRRPVAAAGTGAGRNAAEAMTAAACSPPIMPPAAPRSVPKRATPMALPTGRDTLNTADATPAALSAGLAP